MSEMAKFVVALRTPLKRNGRQSDWARHSKTRSFHRNSLAKRKEKNNISEGAH